MAALLFSLLQQVMRLPVKPPVTIGVLAVNVYVHLAQRFPSVTAVCLQPLQMLQAMAQGRVPLERLLVSGFVHADDMHLYYNMVSLVWKGANLEIAMGSQAFAVLVAVSLVLSHAYVVLISYIAAEVFEYYEPLHMCAVGFSAVLFALKFVWNDMAPQTQHVMGLAVPAKYAAWLELVLIQLMVPRASFLGHLCGILAGATYVYANKYLPRMNLLPRQPSYTYARGTTGGGQRRATQTHRASAQAATAADEGEEEALVREAIRRSMEDYYDGPASHNHAEYKQPEPAIRMRPPPTAPVASAPPPEEAADASRRQPTPEEIRELRLRRLGKT